MPHNTNWIETVTNGGFSRTQTLLPKTNVLERVQSQWAGTNVGDFQSLFEPNNEPRGWRTQENRSGSVVAAGLGAHFQTFRYNERGELRESHNSMSWPRNLNFTYDQAGNRTQYHDWGAGSTNYAAAAANHYTSITGPLGESPLAHDTDGNMTQDGTWTYAYDGENRLKSMTRLDLSQTLTFTYDYADRRVRKQVSGGSDLKFIWSGWTLAAETVSDGYSIWRTHIWGPDFSNAQGAAGGAGALLGTYNVNFVLTYAVPDSMGNIVGHIDTGGNVAAAVEYSVFGRVLGSSGNVANHPVGYAGQYTDWETGLVYYGYRYYNPKHGRFINRDPIGESGGNNLYNFVGNNPASRWDVLGLDWTDPFWNYVNHIAENYRPWNNIWFYFSPGMRGHQPFTTGTITQPNESYNDGRLNDWRIGDAIKRAQGAANSSGLSATGGAGTPYSGTETKDERLERLLSVLEDQGNRGIAHAKEAYERLRLLKDSGRLRLVDEVADENGVPPTPPSRGDPGITLGGVDDSLPVHAWRTTGVDIRNDADDAEVLATMVHEARHASQVHPLKKGDVDKYSRADYENDAYYYEEEYRLAVASWGCPRCR